MNNDLSQLVANYKMSNATAELVRSTPIVLLVGVAGAGKDSIKRELLKTGQYHDIVSHTTRKPRINNGVLEQDGISYHFVDITEAQRMIEAAEFVEAKLVHGTDVYGTSVAEIERAHRDGKIAITDVDVQGVAEYKQISDRVIAIFVLPPTFEEWQRRLRARYSDGLDEQDIRRRMHTAIAELEEALAQPYYHFVVNENLGEAVKAADSIAHHRDEFTTIDRSFRVWAERLLDELQKEQ